MPAQANANVIALQLEKVRDKVPLLYERDDILLTMIQQRGDVEKVSSRNMRLPLQVNPGGKAGSYNADGGDLGRGSGTAYDVAQVSPIFFRFAIEITKLVEYATTGRERIMELQPTGLHQRVPVFLGSKKEVEVATHYHVEADAAA